MNVFYDRETDSLVIILRDAPIQESDEVRPGVIADFGEDGGVVRFEVLRASRVVEDAEQVQFATTEMALGPVPLFLEMGMSTFQTASEGVAKVWFRQFKEIVHAEVFSDFLNIADHLISDDGFKGPAAVLAGGVLEEHLRMICQKHGIATQAQGRRGMEPKKASAMNDDLLKQHVYTQVEWGSVRLWLDYRNDAAHGAYQKYDQNQIKQMIDGIRDFLVRYPA